MTDNINPKGTMNKRNIITYAAIAVVSLGIGGAVAGGSSKAAPSSQASTVTTPAKTTTVTVQGGTPDECRTMGLQLVKSERILISAAQGYVSLFTPLYKAGVLGTPVDAIVAKMNRQTDKVKQANAAIPDNATIDKCFGG